MSIKLSASSSTLPTTTPHLMPFHIEYTGPAPLSTYFLVKPTSPPEGSSEAEDANLAQRVKTRFLSAFRGRTIQGLAVDLPEDFSGVVLSSEDMGKGKCGNGRNGSMEQKRSAVLKSKSKKGGRATRSSTRGQKDDKDEDEDVNMQDQETHEDSADSALYKTLRPTSKFSSFTLWNADVDVDEGRDEFLRSLSEYQRLSAEVHRIDT